VISKLSQQGVFEMYGYFFDRPTYRAKDCSTVTIRQKKTAKELEQLALEIVRRMQGCSHVEDVTVSSNPDKGWFISSCTPAHANSSDVRRAILIAEADLIDRFDLTWDNKTG
jgi:hypothetical protein